MLIERQLENDFIAELKSMPELSASQVVGSREVAAAGDTKSEEDTKATIVAVACGFRQNDAFSLTPITMSMSITVMTRAELDPTSEGHSAVVEAIADLLSRWHKDGVVMSAALTNEKFLAGELRMDGGTARTYDSMTQTWSETISFSIRGAEKFLVMETKAKYADGSVSLLDIRGKLNQVDMPNRTQLASVEIGNSVTSIGDFAFNSCSGLTSVTIPDSVTSIGDDAFAYCSGLTSVTIPNSVTSIEEYAFNSCTGLTSVTIPDSVTSIRDGVFRSCDGLTSVMIPDSVTSIGYRAFFDCDGLTSVTIPDSVTSIRAEAFSACSYLKSVTIGNGVTSIGSSAFSGCRHLKSVTFSGKTKATVQGMENYTWGVPSGCVLHCTDGDITI